MFEMNILESQKLVESLTTDSIDSHTELSHALTALNKIARVCRRQNVPKAIHDVLEQYFDELTRRHP